MSKATDIVPTRSVRHLRRRRYDGSNMNKHKNSMTNQTKTAVRTPSTASALHQGATNAIVKMKHARTTHTVNCNRQQLARCVPKAPARLDGRASLTSPSRRLRGTA